MKKIICTLDLNTKGLSAKQIGKAYTDLEDVMNKMKFVNVSPKKNIEFPYNTYYRDYDFKIGIDVFRDKLWEHLKAKKIPVNRLFGGKLTEWAIKVKL